MSARPTAPDETPRHVGIIMDGNGRWAERCRRPRVLGHRLGVETARRITEAALRFGLAQLTLFAFSSENWRRPATEVQFLMRLLRRFLRRESGRLADNGVRLMAIGRLHELPPDVAAELHRTVQASRAGSRMTLCLAVNYGGRAELADACREIAGRAVLGRIAPERVNEEAVESCLYQPDMPPLDLIIRTGGEMRLSNFLLWQAAYAELWVTPVCWPEFREEHLLEAVADFRTRRRRFGGLSPPGVGA